MSARWRRELRHGAAFSTVLLALLTLAPASARQVPLTAPADHFVDAIGINIHLHYDNTLYRDRFDLVKSRLLELGVRHVRDGLEDTAWHEYYDRHNELGDAGIRGTFITSFDQSLELLAAYPSRVVRSFEAYEAPNEADMSHDPQWVTKVRRSMMRLAGLRDIASVSHYPIIGPSLTREVSYSQVGDLSAFFDQANLHNYLAGRHPGTTGWGDNGYGSIDWNLRLIRRFSGGKPIVTTEIGYQDGPGIQDSVPQDVVARYVPRLLIEQYRLGIVRTFLYELADFPNSGAYGLLHPDGTPKPAFHAVKALLAILADQGPAYSVHPLAYEVDDPGNVRHLMFQKRDGTYFLALWIEEGSYDPPVRQSHAVAGRAVTLRLPREMLLVRAYRWQPDGTAESRPIRTVTASTRVDLSDQLLLLEVAEPGTAIASVP